MEFAEKLVAIGADPNIENKEGLSAVKLCENKNIKNLKFKPV